jgi:hypothetical protein
VAGSGPLHLAFERSAALEAERLDETRLVALEERIEADLALGRDAVLVGELRELVAEHPLRERFRGQLMLALYRAGRQAEALDAFRDARRALVEELGLEPGPELRALERAILAHDPGLRQAPPPRGEARPRPAAETAPRLASLTSLIGRERELRQVGELLTRDGARLITLTGPGGIGKTKLAQAGLERFGDRFADGTAAALLAGVRDPALVLPEIARAVGVGEHGSEPLAERVGRALRESDLLLLLDNFEQVADAAPVLIGLLADAPGLRLLVTSRVLLHVSDEHVFAVPPLALPELGAAPDRDAVIASEAVQLFVACSRGGAARPLRGAACTADRRTARCAGTSAYAACDA